MFSKYKKIFFKNSKSKENDELEAENLSLINKDSNVLDGMCADLLRLPMFSSEEIKEGLGSEDKVKGRIKSAIEVFSCG